MRLIDRLELIQRRLLADERGWFLKVLDGGEAGLPPRVGKVYLTAAKRRQPRWKSDGARPDRMPLAEGIRALVCAEPLS